MGRRKLLPMFSLGWAFWSFTPKIQFCAPIFARVLDNASNTLEHIHVFIIQDSSITDITLCFALLGSPDIGLILSYLENYLT